MSSIPVSSRRIFSHVESTCIHQVFEQTRRLVRTVKVTAIKENENTNARPSKMATRTKPGALAFGTSLTVAPAGGVSRPTAASKAKASIADSKAELPAGKRKREALGEVSVAGNKPVAGAIKGKQKEAFDGVVIKPRPLTSRPPLKTVTGRPTSQVIRETTRDVKVAVVTEKDHAMVVDPVPIPSLTTRRSNLPSDSAAPRKTVGHRRTSSRLAATPLKELEAELDEEEEPLHKKRRTSSIPPEEPEVPEMTEEELYQARVQAEIEAFANEAEADPETSAWDDLDAEDADDPLMVSEYVQDIVKYMKQLEVRPIVSFLVLF